jgi:hypothetical protein
VQQRRITRVRVSVPLLKWLNQNGKNVVKVLCTVSRWNTFRAYHQLRSGLFLKPNGSVSRVNWLGPCFS